MGEYVTWNTQEANLQKQPQVYNEFIYDTVTNGGCLAKFDEVAQLIIQINNDVADITQKYVQLQGMYNSFTDYNAVMYDNATKLSGNFAEIQQAYQLIINEMNTQIATMQQTDSTLMTDLNAIQQGLGNGAVDATAPTTEAGFMPSDPYASYVNPTAGYTDPTTGYTDPTAGYVDPTAGYVDPNSIFPQTTPTVVPSGPTIGGFTMPSGNELETVYKIIAAEGGNISPNEAVNIASTMINRARTGGWYGGNDIYKIATAKHQYVVYETGKYKSASLSPESRAAVDQLFASCAMGGNTAHGYSSFRSHGSTGYKGTVLEPGGNRYA